MSQENSLKCIIGEGAREQEEEHKKKNITQFM